MNTKAMAREIATWHYGDDLDSPRMQGETISVNYNALVDKITAALNQARSEALEEAAKICDSIHHPTIASSIGRQIRALKNGSNNG